MIDNFKRPYFSKSINEYWRRWHISLGAWMKDYIFNPLAISGPFLNASKKMRGTRFGKTKAGAHIAKVLPTAFASLIVFLLVGVWHGASYKYVAFGLWNGVIIMLSTLMQPLFDGAVDKLHINRKNPFFCFFQMFRTFIVVLVGYVFDVAPTFEHGMMTIGRFFTDQNFERGIDEINTLGLSFKDYILLGICTVTLLVISIIQERHSDTTMREMLDKKPFILRFVLYFICVMAVIIFGIYGSGYAAADFVYMQF
jgi:D-alanyl-lipoteichoic acid acyltransferase DltB (MBOAT superfamily)